MMWKALAEIFAYPVVHRDCGELVLWARRDVQVGDIMSSTDYAHNCGAQCSPDEIIRCPVHGSIGTYGAVAGWR